MFVIESALSFWNIVLFGSYNVIIINIDVSGDLMDLSCCGDPSGDQVHFAILSTIEGRSQITTLKLPVHVLAERKLKILY